MNSVTYSQDMATKLTNVESQIKQATRNQESPSQRTMGYLDALYQIHGMTKPLFRMIYDTAKKAGYMGVERLTAFPKGMVENFNIAVRNSQGQITDVVLAKNKKFGFYQNGGGKTRPEETSKECAVREAGEEFTFPGTMDDMVYLTIESRSNITPSFPWVKGVHLAFVTPDQAATLKLSDDMKSNDMVIQKREEYLHTIASASEKDQKDHWFDRIWMAKYISEQPEAQTFLQYPEHEISETDYEIAQAHSKLINSVQVPLEQIECMRRIIDSFLETCTVDSRARDTDWKKERDAVKKAAQGIVDSLSSHFFGKYGFEAKTCHVKVQETAGVYLNGEPIPGFSTIPQMLAMQNEFNGNRRFEIVAVESLEDGFIRNIITK